MALKRTDVAEQYKWDLSSIYPSKEDWEADYQKLLGELPKLSALKESLTSSASALAAGLDEIYSAMHRVEKLFVYARMGKDENNAGAAFQELAQRAQGVSVKLSAAVSYMEPLILSMDENALRAYMKDEGLKQYRFMLENLLRGKAHVRNEEEEYILSLAGSFAGGAQDIFTMLENADLKFGSFEHGEKTYELTHATYAELIQSPDRELRKKAFFQYYAAFQSHINTIAASYATSVKKDVFFSKVRKFDSAREMELFPDDVPEEVYDSLLASVHKNLPVMHEYVALRKKVLGVEELQMYDVYAPLVPEMDAKFTYEEAREKVLAALSVLGQDYADTLKEAFSSRWIDVFETEAKTSGAYSWGVYGTHPYVLLNHREDLDSVFTLAHELGHAMHSYYSDGAQPYVTAQYPIFLAEIASTVNEIILTKHLLATVTDEKLKKYVLNHYIEQFKGTVIRQTMFAEFEKIAHEMAEKDEALTVEALSKAYGALNKRYFGPDMGEDQTIFIEWARIPHFYNAFYVYKYATGFSCASAIVSKLSEPGFKEKYRNFLRAGGSDHPVAILKELGIGVGEAVDLCMKEFGRALKEFKALV